MAANGSTSIPTPTLLALRRARYQVLPVVTMLLCASLAGWLWARNARSISAFGEVSAVKVALESKYEGMLQELPRPVKLFDSVRAGQIVARIDTSAAEAELQRIEAELKQSLSSSATENQARKARQEELRQRIAARDIKSPIDGTIIAIHQRPGQSAKLAMPIMTIAAERGEFIVGYLHADRAIRPVPGMVVTISTRGSPSRAMQSYVQSVGPQVQELPKRFFRDPNMPEWALPVQIVIPPEAELKPGEVLDLVFHPRDRRSS